MASPHPRRSPDTVPQPEGPARARALIYHALAEALAGPAAGTQDLLLEAVTAGARALDSAACRQAALALAALLPLDLEALRAGYARLIAHPGRRPVALYESLHRGGGLMGQAVWEVERRYRALGLAAVKGELPDHASVELAFLGHLVAAEAEARAVNDGRLAARLRAEQRAFLRAHAAAWLPDVGVELAAAGPDGRFGPGAGSRVMRRSPLPGLNLIIPYVDRMLKVDTRSEAAPSSRCRSTLWGPCRTRW